MLNCTLEGNTERQFLSNIESIVRNSLPHEKLRTYFQDPEAAKQALLNKVTFCSEQVKVQLKRVTDIKIHVTV